MPIDTPRDRNHPDFPLYIHKTHGGHRNWVAAVNGCRSMFGSVKADPEGVLAWKLYDIELQARLSGDNPRTVKQRSALGLYWMAQAPLSKTGIAIIDPHIGRLVCTNCGSVWRIRFYAHSYHLIRKTILCRHGCPLLVPYEEVRDAILGAILPETISVKTYDRLVKARQSGWVAAPQDIDSIAEAEGRALSTFMSKFIVKGPKPLAARRRVVDRAALMETNALPESRSIDLPSPKLRRATLKPQADKRRSPATVGAAHAPSTSERRLRSDAGSDRDYLGDHKLSQIKLRWERLQKAKSREAERDQPCES